MARAFKILPKNYLDDFGEFEAWGAGVTSIPSGWVASTSCTYFADLTNKKYGNNGLGVVAVAAGGGLYRTIPDGSDYAGRTFKLGIWAKAATTGPYFSIYDGVTESTLHVTNTAFTEYNIIKKLDAAATQLRVNIYVPVNLSTAYFDSAYLVEGEDAFTNFDTNIDVSDWSPALNLKMDQYEIANREGSYVPEFHLQSRNVKVKGNVVGTDVVSCRTNFDNMMKSLLSWKTSEKRGLYLYDDRVLEVFLKSFDWNYVNGLNMVKYNCQFVAPDSTTRYVGKLRTRQVIAATNTEFNFAYNGNADSKPSIKIVADQAEIVGTCTIQNLTTGETFSYGASVATASVIDIDCDLGTVEVDGVNTIQNFSGDFLKLVRGTNYLKHSGNKCTIHIDYFERWF